MTSSVRPRRGRTGRRLRAVLAVVVALAAVGVMVRLSIWQWDRGRARGSVLNYSYALEWLVFAVLTVVGLVRLWREGSRSEDGSPPAPPARSPESPLVGPPLQPGEDLEELTWVRLRRRIGLGRD